MPLSKTFFGRILKPQEDAQRRYLVMFDTLPGNGIFEATIYHSVDKRVKLVGDVSWQKNSLYTRENVFVKKIFDD